MEKGQETQQEYRGLIRSYYPQHPPGEMSCSWFGWVYASLDVELAQWSSPESGGKQG